MLSRKSISTHSTRPYDSPLSTFIVGSIRSGTTLLYRSLQGHPWFRCRNVISPIGIDVTESRVFQFPNSCLDASGNAFRFMLADADVRDAFLCSAWSFRLRHFIFKILVPGRLRSRLAAISPVAWHVLARDRLVRMYFTYALTARGAHCLLEKSPQTIDYLTFVDRCFPNAKLIYLARHPLDQFVSIRLRTRQEMANGSRPAFANLDRDPDAFVKRYARELRTALRRSRLNPQRFRLVRYEDLTTEPRATLMSLCAFIGIPWNESVLPIAMDILSRKPYVNPLLFDAITVNRHDWRKVLSPAEATRIECPLRPFLTALAYPSRL